MMIRLLLCITLALCNNTRCATPPTVQCQWRVLPVLSKHWKTSLSTKERVLGHISLRSFFELFADQKKIQEMRSHEPLYHLGAPSKIFSLDYIDSKISMYSMRFVRRGYFSKTPRRPVSKYLDPELMKCVRQTTGVDDPYVWDVPAGFPPGNLDCVYLLEILLDEQVCLKLRPKHCVAATFASMERPFVFISSRLTDEMLINELKNTRLEDLLESIALLRRRWRFSPDTAAEKEAAEKVLNHYRTRYARWRKELDKLPETIDSHLMVCIEDMPIHA